MKAYLSTSIQRVLVCTLGFICWAAQPSHAGSATWDTNPANGDWYTAANWTPQTVPDSFSDTATFGSSSVTAVSLSAGADLNGIVFNPGANSFTITVEAEPEGNYFTLEGAGIVNSSGLPQNFVIAGAGNGTIGGSLQLINAAAGDQTTFTVQGGSAEGQHGAILYLADNVSASNCTITTDGGLVEDALGGSTEWASEVAPVNCTFIAEGGKLPGAEGGQISFFFALGNSTLIATDGAPNSYESGGSITLESSITGTPRVELFGNGTLSLEFEAFSIGSLEGDGLVSLKTSSLTIGTNNLNTRFSGIISGEAGCALTKTGKGKLTLSGANTYPGKTTIRTGSLSVTNTTGSATGTGPVSAIGGTLAGTGTISGRVSIGATRRKGFLAPGDGATLGVLTLASTLTFGSLGTYEASFNSSTVATSAISANGVTINAGAQIALDDLGTASLPAGTVFTMINNTSHTAISGTFANLADGAIISVGNNTYKANYEGGDGNDLTLTVQ